MKYLKDLTDEEKLQIYDEICNSELYKETLQRVLPYYLENLEQLIQVSI